MSFKDIKAKQAQRGFTIVELLIVIVVIGILAAITLVSYNGITSRANAASAKAAAATVQKKFELYQADSGEGRYPHQTSELASAPTSASYYLPTNNPNWSFSATGSLSAGNGTNTVFVRKCAPTVTDQVSITDNITGAEIYYWDYAEGAVTEEPLTVGATSNCPDEEEDD